MKKISYNYSDAEECVSGFRKLTENIISDVSLIKKIRMSGEISDSLDEKLADIEKRLLSVAADAEHTGNTAAGIAAGFEETEEKIKLLIRKKIFEHNGHIVVEKTMEAEKSEILCGHTLKHNESISRLIMKKTAGDRL